MALSAGITTLRLLYYYLRAPAGPRHDVRERSLDIDDPASPVAVFEPLKEPKRNLVLVHGVTGRANADPSIVHLGRSLAALGYRCLVPALQQIAHFRHDAADIDTLTATIERGSAEHAVSVLAFSYGASYALSAVADPRIRERCDALVGFGAYYTLAEALEHQRLLLVRNPDPHRDDADICYLRYTLLACHRDELGLSAEAWRDIDATLVNFTSPQPIESKRASLLRYAAELDYVALMQSYQSRQISPRLSPKDTLRDVRCSVGLLHDPNDRFVPPNHVQRIREQLDSRPFCPETRVLTTPMLSHVQVDPMRRVFDVPKLMRLLEPVLAPHRQSNC
jgi:pimeloyl-ACP methyl ester carboxylesterase